MSEWRYQQTSIAADRYSPSRERFDNAVNAHLAEMADAGWELVTATSTMGESHFHGSETKSHHYIWKRPR